MIRKYDIVIFGASGFGGRLIAEYFASWYATGDSKLNFALAGRNKKKLEDVKGELFFATDAATKVDILIGDCDDLESLKAIARQTKVILSTAGPFALYGENLVRACAEEGTNYCNITGEVQWVDLMAARYDIQARASGACLVSCAGFDSVPSDIGTLTIVEEFKKLYGTEPTKVEASLESLRGSFQGGTIATMANYFTNGFVKAPKSLSEPKGHTTLVPTRFISRRSDGRYMYPFVLSPNNMAIVKRSNKILGYSKKMSFSEYGAGSLGAAVATYAGIAFLICSLSIKPLRWLILKCLPKPGEGPDRQTMENGRFNLRFTASANGSSHSMMWKAKGDPSCIQTTIMAAETAVVLATESVPAGFHTPASGAGKKLMDRLLKTQWKEGFSPAIQMSSL